MDQAQRSEGRAVTPGVRNSTNLQEYKRWATTLSTGDALSLGYYFPRLGAKTILPIHACSTASERSFSKAGFAVSQILREEQY